MLPPQMFSSSSFFFFIESHSYQQDLHSEKASSSFLENTPNLLTRLPLCKHQEVHSRKIRLNVNARLICMCLCVDAEILSSFVMFTLPKSISWCLQMVRGRTDGKTSLWVIYILLYSTICFSHESIYLCSRFCDVLLVLLFFWWSSPFTQSCFCSLDL